jgi:DNA-directed RNA polymerase II subunit RPB1
MFLFNKSSAEIRTVRKLQLGVLSPDEIRAMSVVKVTNPGSFQNGRALQDGLADLRLGAADRHTTCSTCRNTYTGDKSNDC